MTAGEASGATGDERWAWLLKRLRALPETAMRREVLAEQLMDREPSEVLDFLRVVVEGADKRRAAHLTALEAVSEWILAGQKQESVYEFLTEVYRLAREEGHEGVSRLLVIASPQRGPVGPEQTPGDVDLDRLSLGERKFLARGHDRDRLDRLLLDPEPSVVRNLLRNPNLVERDVMRLATRRPVRAEILREVYASRWGKRYGIRLALASNPYTPTDLSLKLVGFLLRKDLRNIAADGVLHELVRAEARRLVARRRAPKEEKGS